MATFGPACFVVRDSLLGSKSVTLIGRRIDKLVRLSASVFDTFSVLIVVYIASIGTCGSTLLICAIMNVTSVLRVPIMLFAVPPSQQRCVAVAIPRGDIAVIPNLCRLAVWAMLATGAKAPQGWKAACDRGGKGGETDPQEE